MVSLAIVASPADMSFASLSPEAMGEHQRFSDAARNVREEFQSAAPLSAEAPPARFAGRRGHGKPTLAAAASSDALANKALEWKRGTYDDQRFRQQPGSLGGGYRLWLPLLCDLTGYASDGPTLIANE
jgi:hypothetical protein